jgi:hypothetical protein
MEDQEQPPPDPGHHAAAAPSIKLPPFWASNPEAWFGMAAGQFILRGVADERHQFYYAVGALPEAVVRTVADLLRGQPPADAFTQLRNRLLISHTLTEMQRLDKLVALNAYPGHKPSDVLAELSQFCPAGDLGSRLFRLLFLRQLPSDLRVLLAEDVATPLPALAARGDQLWSHSLQHKEHTVAAVAAPTGEESGQAGVPVAAVAPLYKKKRDQGKRPAAAAELCWKHKKFGADTYNCASPATCPGN